MEQKDKELLIKDLCARLPYDTVVYYKTDGWESQYDTLSPQIIDNMFHRFDIIVKPYLRPMSSMTEEEKKELYKIIGFNGEDENGWIRCDNIHTIYGISLLGINELIDWLNAHNLDYRGLIEKGLAIDVTEENNPYK